MVEMYLGQREQIAWVEEDGGYATLGSNTMSNAGEVIGKNVILTPDFSQNWNEIINAGADTREIEGLEKGPELFRFKLSFSPVNWKWLLFCAHGNSVDTGSNPTTHTFATTNSVNSARLEWAKRGNVNEVWTLTGIVIKSFKMSWSKGTGEREGLLMVEAECVAQDASKGTSVTSLSAATGDAFKFYMAKLTYAGSEFVEMNSGELSFDNGVEEEDSLYANSTLDRHIGEPIPKTLKYTLSININQKDSTFTDDFIAAIAVTGTHTIEFIRSSNDKITFTMLNQYVDSIPGPTNLDGINTQDIVLRPLTVNPVAVDDLATYW